MSRATSQMRDLAAHLIAHETKGNVSSESRAPAGFHVCERLRPHLSTLMGKAGFRAVLSRALAVVSKDVPWLAAVKVNADGTLEGWEAAEATVAPNDRSKTCELLVAQVLALLVAFIGDNLALRLVRDVWPNVSLEDLNFTPRDHP